MIDIQKNNNRFKNQFKRNSIHYKKIKIVKVVYNRVKLLIKVLNNKFNCLK